MTTATTPSPTIRWGKFAPLCIILVGVIAYANSLGSPFIFDDEVTLRVYPESAIFATTTLIPRGLVNATFLLNYYLDGHHVAGYRAVNILIHIFAALLLFGIVRRSLLLPRLAERFSASSTGLAMAVATAWLVHPMPVESVTYICQRYESMTGMFCLLSLYSFVRAVQSLQHPRLWTDISIVSAICAMWSKQTAVTLPFIILLFDFLLVARLPMDPIRIRWKTHTALMATLGIIFVLMVNSIRYGVEADTPQTIAMSPIEYLATQCGVIMHYLRSAVFPTGLCLDYAWPPVTKLADAIPEAIALITLFLVTLIGIVRRHPMAFLSATFFLILAPTSSIFPIADMAADRRFYLPLAAVLACLFIGLQACLTRGTTASKSAALPPNRQLGLPLALLLVIFILGLLAGAIHRNGIFSSREAMYRDIITKRPANYRQHIALGDFLLSQGRWADAEHELRPLVSRMKETRYSADKQYNLAASNFNRLFPAAMTDLGRALLCQGRHQEAMNCFREVLALGPDPFATHNLSLAMFLDGQRASAIRLLSDAIQSGQPSAKAYSLLGWFHKEEHEDAAAIDAMKRAIDLDPGLLDTKLSLAWLLATTPIQICQDPQAAIALATDVCKATQFSSPRALDVLAAAYARASQYDKAIECISQALSLMNSSSSSSAVTPDSQDADFTDIAMKQRLYLYNRGLPYQRTP